MTPDPSKDTDALIVGAGAVGLACGYALAQAGLRVIVLEAGPRIGEGVSARNSEVIHAGLYYPTDSLKARLCINGRRSLYPFLESHGVSYRRCGKLVVANFLAKRCRHTWFQIAGSRSRRYKILRIDVLED